MQREETRQRKAPRWLPDKRAKEELAKPRWVAKKPLFLKNGCTQHMTDTPVETHVTRCATRHLLCVTVGRKEGRNEGMKE